MGKNARQRARSAVALVALGCLAWLLPSSAAATARNVLFTYRYPTSGNYAGVAIYHVVVAPDGKPSEIAVGRPIGFGLDENAVASIRKASFQPAIKDGRPVPVLVDLTGRWSQL